MAKRSLPHGNPLFYFPSTIFGKVAIFQARYGAKPGFRDSFERNHKLPRDERLDRAEEQFRTALAKIPGHEITASGRVNLPLPLARQHLDTILSAVREFAERVTMAQ